MAEEDNVQAADAAGPKSVEELGALLADKSRRVRQEVSGEVYARAKEDAQEVAGIAGALVAALEMPEAQTRWQCLEALSEVALVNPDVTFDAFAGAEESLFDESSASVRLAAFRFLCRYGATSAAHSDEAWPLMSEAVQCYHGDPEYRDMLLCLREFVQGSVSDDVRGKLKDRMKFDANNGRGLIKVYSLEICAAAGEA